MLKKKVFICLVLLILTCLMMTIGNTHYSLMEVISIILSGETTGPGYTINKLRLPKMLLGALAGFAFGVSGYTFQTLLRNPLASPDMIGITAGSSAGAVFTILILKLSGYIVSVISVFSGLFVTLLIFLLAGKSMKQANGKMILIGIGVQAMLNSMISWMLLVGSEYDVSTAMRWMRGSLNDVKMEDVIPTFFIFTISMMGLTWIKKDLIIMQLGDEYPISLGVRTKRVRLLATVFALLLSAAATAVTGPIASIAFLSAPIASRIFGGSSDNMFSAGLIGAILVYSGELIGQNCFQVRYSVGVITGLLGAPYLLYLLVQMNKEGKKL